jgi:hypothetical protein
MESIGDLSMTAVMRHRNGSGREKEIQIVVDPSKKTCCERCISLAFYENFILK